jgi:hypothetical protein
MVTFLQPRTTIEKTDNWSQGISFVGRKVNRKAVEGKTERNRGSLEYRSARTAHLGTKSNFSHFEEKETCSS